MEEDLKQKWIMTARDPKFKNLKFIDGVTFNSKKNSCIILGLQIGIQYVESVIVDGHTKYIYEYDAKSLSELFIKLDLDNALYDDPIAY